MVAWSKLLYVNEVITSKLQFTGQNTESCVAQAGICSLFLHIVSLDKHGKYPTASERSYCTFSWSTVLIGSQHPEVNSGSGFKSTGKYTEHVCLCA